MGLYVDGFYQQSLPDGNRRFAKKNKKDPWEGHFAGSEKIHDILRWCTEYPEIKTISIFALSTENLTRDKKEIEELWSLFESELKKITNDPEIKENGIQVRIFGNDRLWNPSVKQAVREAIESTKHYSKNILNIMLAYGSKFEIDNAIKGVVKKPIETIDKFLMVKEPLDLVIRTGGQRRLSNFMLYQASYAELYFTDTLWPDFSKKEFDEVIKWYHNQIKNFGK